MRRRTVLALFVVLVLGWIPASLATQHFKPGSELARWPIKTTLPENSDPSQAKTTVKLDDLFRLSLPDQIDARDARWRTERLPKFQTPLEIAEGDIVAVEGYVRLLVSDSDGDYHIQIAPSPEGAEYECLIVEIPRPEPEFVKDQKLRDLFAEKRAWLRDQLLNGKEPSGNGSVIQRPTYVRVLGQLFYDGWHTGGKRGKRGCTSPTLWEIHPITDFSFAPGP